MLASRKALLIFGLVSCGIVLASLCLWYNMAALGFFKSAVAQVRGYALLVDPTHTSVQADETTGKAAATFTVSNVTSSPVTILGAKTSCGCAAPPDLPLLIPPKGKVQMTFRITVGTGRKTAESSGILYLDVPSRPIVLFIEAHLDTATKQAGSATN